ncbi:hypothetical protein MY8738_010203 [Beauveria namnaoensis]
MQPPQRALGRLHDKKCDVWAAGQKALVPAWSRADAEVEGHDAHNDSEISREYQHHHNGGALGGGVVGRSTKPVISESSIELGPPLNEVWVAWTQFSLNLLITPSGVGIVGRIVPNFTADCIDAVNVFMPTSIIVSVLVYCFIAIYRPLGVSMGMAFAIVGFVMLTGPPIAGTIFASPARYTSAKVFAASPIAAVCGFSIAGKAARIPSKGLNWISRI